MKRNRVVVVVGLMGVGALVTGCAKKDVEKYLGKNGGDKGLYHWEERMQKAVCQIEEHVTGLDPDVQICPPPPRGITPPPSYPPN